MNTAGLFSKNGLLWQPVGFNTFQYSSNLWIHDSGEYSMKGGNDFYVKLGKSGQYFPMIQISGHGVYEGESASSLSTAKKRAMKMAMDAGILFFEVNHEQTI